MLMPRIPDALLDTLRSVLSGARGMYDGYATILSMLLEKPITEQFPEERRALPPRSRAKIILTRSPDGDERCVACHLCSAVCPVSCISMEADTREDGRRYARWFRINFSRCIYCGLCEEACPTLAIQLTPEFDFSKADIHELLAEKEQLLVDHGGKNADYDFYRVAGVAEKGGKGTRPGEKPPVNVKTNLP